MKFLKNLLLSLLPLVYFTAEEDAPRRALPGKNTNNLGVGLIDKSMMVPTEEEIEGIAKKMVTRVRSVDAFGLMNYPKEKAVGEDGDDITPDVISLTKALGTLKLNGINLIKQEIMLGARAVRQGDVLHLDYRGSQYFAELIEVTSTQVNFRDIKKNELGVIGHAIVKTLSIEPMTNRPEMDTKSGKFIPSEASP
jgi:hypothetical protein